LAHGSIWTEPDDNDDITSIVFLSPKKHVPGGHRYREAVDFWYIKVAPPEFVEFVKGWLKLFE